MADDRPTKPPPSPSSRRLFAPLRDNKRVAEAVDKILGALRSGVRNLIDNFFDRARDVVEIAVMHATHDVYNAGIEVGRNQARAVFHAYLDALDARSAELQVDPRVEYARPVVTVADVRASLRARGTDLTTQEVVKLAVELQIVLAQDAG